jgi:GT2 family glycosyltransferase
VKIAIVILNWNGRLLLERFLPSVVKYSEEATIYVADNASTDESVLFLKNRFPLVKVLQNTENGGYAKGYNDALKQVPQELILLLNSDVEVTQGWLKPIQNEFENDSKLVAAQPKVLDYKNKTHFEYAGAAGGFIDALGYPYCRGRIFNTLEEDTGQYDDISTIFWASGACLAIKNEAFKNIGGFDEDLFAHQEEIDLCWRLQLEGGLIKYIYNSKVYHLGGGTLSTKNPKKTFYNFRNSLLVLVKNDASNRLIVKIISRLVLDGVAAFKFLLSGKPQHMFAVLKAHISFYVLLFKFINKRPNTGVSISYYSVRSIVFQYYLKGYRTFKELYN